MRINRSQLLLERAFVHKLKVLLVSKPGSGKTWSVKEVVRKLVYDLIILSVPLQSPVKVGGYPRPPADPDGDATHCLFDGIARAMRATKPTVLFWDDLGAGNGETLKSVMDTIQFGTIDGRKFPDCVVQVAASNDVGHMAGVEGLIEPLKSKFDTIVHVETHIDDVVQHGLANGWPAWLLAYLRNSPGALDDWKPSKSLTIDGGSPRGWDHVGQWDNIGEDDVEVWGGCVGKGRALEAYAFKQLASKVPDVDAILLSPDTAPVPEEPDIRYFVAMAIASRIDGNNFGRAQTYLHRLPGMFEAFSIIDAIAAEAKRKADGKLQAGHKLIQTSKDFIAWSVTPLAKSIQAA